MSIMDRFSSESREIAAAERRRTTCADITRVTAELLAARNVWPTQAKTNGTVEVVTGASFDRASQMNRCFAEYARVGKGAVEVTCITECPLGLPALEESMASPAVAEI